MGENVTPYVDFNRAWIVKDCIEKFFRAKNLNRDVNHQFNKGNRDVFEHLVVLSELLWDIRDQVFLIYKRPVEHKNSVYEEELKYTPNHDIMQFVNTVGLLFHKVLIARELSYTTEFYEPDKSEHSLSVMLKEYIERIDELFKVASERVLPFIACHTDDAVVLCYLLENDAYIQSSLSMELKNILKQLEISGGLENAFIDAVSFCKKNGWDERGDAICDKGLQLWPKNKKLLALKHPEK